MIQNILSDDGGEISWHPEERGRLNYCNEKHPVCVRVCACLSWRDIRFHVCCLFTCDPSRHRSRAVNPQIYTLVSADGSERLSCANINTRIICTSALILLFAWLWGNPVFTCAPSAQDLLCTPDPRSDLSVCQGSVFPHAHVLTRTETYVMPPFKLQKSNTSISKQLLFLWSYF